MTNNVRLPYAAVGETKITDVNERNAAYERNLNAIDGRGFLVGSVTPFKLARAHTLLPVTISIPDLGGHASGDKVGGFLLPAAYSAYGFDTPSSVSIFTGEYAAGTNVQLEFVASPTPGAAFLTIDPVAEGVKSGGTIVKRIGLGITADGPQFWLRMTYTVAPTWKDVAVQFNFLEGLTTL